MTLHLDGVTRRFSGLQALEALHLDIPDGTHAVIGPNGAGKSTLLNLVAGSLRPTSGRIRLDHTDITRLSVPRRAAAGISRTHQHPAVFQHLTVGRHLALAVPPHRRLAAAVRGLVALELVGLADRLRVPAGRLSYGEQRLLELAVALASRPRVLLLDEPSAGLSGQDLKRLRDILTRLTDDRPDLTVVLIDHDLELVWDVADRVTVLHQGCHLITGTAQEVRGHADVQAAYLGVAGTAPSRARRQTDRPLLTARLPELGHSGAPVLAGVELALSVGEAHAVVGPNGAGKTTLLNALAGLHPAPGARISIDGRPVTIRGPLDALRTGIALVPQGRRLWGRLTVAEHLAVARAASPTGANTPDVLDVLPQLALRLRHRGGQLSGGEQQMLAIARALLANPRLLLLDEPAEGLAPTVAADLATLLNNRIDNGLTVLVAEPHMLLAHALADTVHLIGGRKLNGGYGIDHIRRHPEVLATVLPP